VARLFFAIGVSREVTSALESLCSKLKKSAAADNLRFIEPEQAHYTLRFLGEEPPDRQAAAVRAGHAAARGFGPFDLSLRALGVFPDERRPHTLWIGAGRGAPELVQLASQLEGQLLREGFSPGGRAFVPHLTLARVKRRLPPYAMRALLTGPDETIGTLRVASFVLMESKPTNKGTRYIPLETFPLEMPCTPS
jgi:RNA 2',3'-cyclic 3'-phosphodiesterase